MRLNERLFNSSIMIIQIGIKSNYKQIDMSLSDKNPVKKINMLWACQ